MKAPPMSLFDKGIPKPRYFALAAMQLACWYILTFIAVMALAPRLDEPSYSLNQAIWAFVIGVVISPLIENFIFTTVLDVTGGDSRLKTKAFVMAAIAAALHFSWRFFAAFGLFYVIAAVYMTHRGDSRKFALWAGVALHALFNLPAACIPFFLVKT